MNEQLSSLIRSLLKAIGGILVYAGVTDEGMVEQIIGAVMLLAGVVLSFFWHKRDNV